MTVTVSQSPLAPPLLRTDKATWIEVRDKEGYLVYFLFFMPDGASFMTCDKQQQDFEATARNLQIPLHTPPAST